MFVRERSHGEKKRDCKEMGGTWTPYMDSSSGESLISRICTYCTHPMYTTYLGREGLRVRRLKFASRLHHACQRAARGECDSISDTADDLQGD